MEEHRVIRDPRLVAERMARSFESDLYAFIFDNRLVDHSTVKKILSLAGVDQVVGKYARGNIIVYYIRRDLILRKCTYESCADVPREKLEACIADCFIESIREVAANVARSIREAGASIRETV